MTMPDLAIINFSDVTEGEARRAIRAVNRQVADDFQPIWGGGYYCKLHRQPQPANDGAARQPMMIEPDPIPADAAIFLVDRANINSALSYCSLNASALPVAFVFTDLGDWTVTLSHEVLEMIVDSTLGYFLTKEPNSA